MVENSWEHPNVSVFQSDCYEHQDHLIVKAGLILTDAFLKSWNEEDAAAMGDAPGPKATVVNKYYSALAKICNVWRDAAKDIFAAWKSLHGSVDAMARGRRLLPKCDAGRWGCVHDVEERLLHAGPEKIGQCFAKVLVSQKVRATDAEALVAVENDELNQLSDEQNAAYRRMMGRWRREALDLTQSRWFWAIVECAHQSRGPCLHLSAFLKKALDDNTLEKKGAHLCQLATGKAAEIASGFNDVVLSEKWWGILKDWPGACRERLALLAASLVLHHAAGFDRRVTTPMKK